MLIKVTNYCSMGCSHCMEDSTVAGKHMTKEIFLKALQCSARVEKLAWQMGYPPTILLSGGEATEHPDIVEFMEIVFKKKNAICMLITNGMWLDNKELRESILRPEWTHLRVQVATDPRYYPKTPTFKPDDDRILYVPHVQMLIPLGRGVRKSKEPDAPRLPKGPTSFNLRSFTRKFGSIEQAVAVIRLRTLGGSSGFCAPNIDSEGNFIVGETKNCYPVGTVDSTNQELTDAILNMGPCNRCGLEDNLDQAHKRAIGLSSLYAPDEVKIT